MMFFLKIGLQGKKTIVATLNFTRQNFDEPSRINHLGTRGELEETELEELAEDNPGELRSYKKESQWKMRLKTEKDQNMQKKLKPQLFFNLSHINILCGSWNN